MFAPLTTVTPVPGAYPAVNAPHVDVSVLGLNATDIEYIITVTNAAGDAVVDVSVDGVADHLQLANSTGQIVNTYRIDEVARKLWFKKVSGTGNVTVTVAAHHKLR